MATEKLEFSLRLLHDREHLVGVTQQLGLAVRAGWDKGEQKRTLGGAPRPGTYAESYRSLSLGEAVNTDMDDGISECLKKLAPLAKVIHGFVRSGGVAILAVGWFFNSTVGGGRIPPEALTRMSKLGLTLDLYLYCAPEASEDEKESGDTGKR